MVFFVLVGLCAWFGFFAGRDAHTDEQIAAPESAPSENGALAQGGRNNEKDAAFRPDGNESPHPERSGGRAGVVLERKHRDGVYYTLSYHEGGKYPYRISVDTENAGSENIMAAGHFIVRKPDRMPPLDWRERLTAHGLRVARELDTDWFLVSWEERSLVAFFRARDLLSGDADLASSMDPDHLFRVARIPDDPFRGQFPWNLDAIEAPAAWDVRTSSDSVIVAVIDTGIAWEHPDLAANIHINAEEVPGNGEDSDGNGFVDDVYGWNFVEDTPLPHDDDGHGTAIASIIGAVGDNGIGMAGIAWQTRLLAVKFLDEFGEGFDSDAARAIAYARLRGADIVNASWGGPSASAYLRRELDLLGEAGIPVIAAAGNEGEDLARVPFYPAAIDAPHILAVGAMNRDGQRAPFSNHGGRTALYAPGAHVPVLRPGSDFVHISSGTSAAAAHVSGMAALVLAEFPHFSTGELVDQLLDARIFDEGTPGSVGLASLRRAVTGESIGAPEFTETARNRTFNSGEAIELSPTFSSSEPLTSAQWFRNGVPLSGETAVSLRIVDAAPGISGEYRLEIRNRRGIAVHGPFQLIVRPNPPVILSLTPGGMPEPGSSVSLAVEAVARGPITFQWFFNGSPIPGATGSAWTIDSFAESHAGTYRVTLSTRYGDLTSGNIVLGTDPTQLLAAGERITEIPGSNIGSNWIYASFRDRFLAVGESGIYGSPDGIRWTRYRDTNAGQYAYRQIVAMDSWVWSRIGTSALRSRDGQLWERVVPRYFDPVTGDEFQPFSFPWRTTAAGDTLWVIEDKNPPSQTKAMFSMDGAVFHRAALSGHIHGITSSGGEFFALVTPGGILRSPDGITWTAAATVPTGWNHHTRSDAWSDGRGGLFFLNGSHLLFSTDNGASWDHRIYDTAPGGSIERAVALGDNRLAQVGRERLHLFHPDHGWRTTDYVYPETVAATSRVLLYRGSHKEREIFPPTRRVPLAFDPSPLPVASLTGERVQIWGDPVEFQAHVENGTTHSVEYFVNDEWRGLLPAGRPYVFSPSTPGRYGIQARVNHADGTHTHTDHMAVDFMPPFTTLPIMRNAEVFPAQDWLVGRVRNETNGQPPGIYLTRHHDRWELGPIPPPHSFEAITFFNNRVVAFRRNVPPPPEVNAELEIYYYDIAEEYWTLAATRAVHSVSTFVFRHTRNRLFLVDGTRILSSDDGDTWRDEEASSDRPTPFKPLFGEYDGMLHRFHPGLMQFRDTDGTWRTVGDGHFSVPMEATGNAVAFQVSAEGVGFGRGFDFFLHGSDGTRFHHVDGYLGQTAPRITEGFAGDYRSASGLWSRGILLVEDVAGGLRIGFDGTGLARTNGTASWQVPYPAYWNGLFFIEGMASALTLFDFEVPSNSLRVVHEKGKTHYVAVEFEVLSRSFARWENDRPLPFRMEARAEGQNTWNVLHEWHVEATLSPRESRSIQTRALWPHDWQSGVYEFRVRLNAEGGIFERSFENNTAVTGHIAIDLRPSLSAWSAGGGTVYVEGNGDVFEPGDSVTLRAEPLEGHVFIRWTGDLSGRNAERSLTLFADNEVGALFLPWSVALLDRSAVPVDDSGFFHARAGQWYHAPLPDWVHTSGERWIHALYFGDAGLLYDLEEGWLHAPLPERNILFHFGSGTWVVPDADGYTPTAPR